MWKPRMKKTVTIGNVKVFGLQSVDVELTVESKTLQGQTIGAAEIVVSFLRTDRVEELHGVFEVSRQRKGSDVVVRPIEGGVTIHVSPREARDDDNPAILHFERAVFASEPVIEDDGIRPPLYTWHILADKGAYTSTQGDLVPEVPFESSELAYYE